MEHLILAGKELHLLTVDIEKAYDTVAYSLIEEGLERYGCPEDTKRLIMTAHTERTIIFRTGYGTTKEYPVTPQCGLAQGSPISCLLFIMVMQPLLDRLKEETENIPIKKEDKEIVQVTSDVAYTDDLTLIATSKESMKKKCLSLSLSLSITRA